jgi:hypothetical protein
MTTSNPNQSGPSPDGMDPWRKFADRTDKTKGEGELTVGSAARHINAMQEVPGPELTQQPTVAEVPRQLVDAPDTEQPQEKWDRFVHGDQQGKETAKLSPEPNLAEGDRDPRDRVPVGSGAPYDQDG